MNRNFRWTAWVAWIGLLPLSGCGDAQDKATENNQADPPQTGVAAPVVAGADDTPEDAPPNDDADGTPGLPVGKEAPSFRLADQQGEFQTLDAMLEQSNVALVFYRSADW